MFKAFLLGNLILIAAIGGYAAGVLTGGVVKILHKDLVDTIKNIFNKLGGSGGAI